MNEVAKVNESKSIVPDMGGIFANEEKFNVALRMATSLSKSDMVPKQFQNNVSNCVIAVDMAERTKMSPFMVMQNIYIVYGNPSWSSKFVAALINQSRRYAIPLQYEFSNDKQSCYVWAKDHDGNIVKGPVISIDMAKKEGWYSKNGSKWQTMPDIMLMYRAVSFFGKMHCADLLMGIPASDEVLDVGPTYNTAEEEIKAEANNAGEIGFETVEQTTEPVVEVSEDTVQENTQFSEIPNF